MSEVAPPGTTDRTPRGYRSIGDYALIGDAHTAALVSSDGSIDWCCWPCFDSPAVFCRLLDAQKGGWFRVGPAGSSRASRAYIGETNVLATSFHTDGGEARVVDFMPTQRRGSRRGEDIDASHHLMRLIEGLAGEVDFVVEFRPTFDYAREETTITQSAEGAVASHGTQRLRLVTAIPLQADGSGAVSGRVRLCRGDRVWLVMTDDNDPRLTDPDAALEGTLAYWQAWSGLCTYEGPYENLVRRSALALKLLTFEPTGALIAAPTTSLPEEIGGVRNWDYRFTWLRDAALTLNALQSIGYHNEAMDFFDWLESVCLSGQGTIQIMYTVNGGRHLPEEILSHLEGYRHSRPVRVGNAAAQQTQLDIYGEVLDAAYLCHERMRTPHPQMRAVLGLLADRAAARWQEPDQGIWEVRGDPDHFLHSKLLCWVALDRAVRLGEATGMPGDIPRWRRTREEIRHAILTRGYHQGMQTFTQTFDGDALDASALVIPLVGFLPATDPRMRATIARIEEGLTSNGLVYRYRTEDGLPGGEGTFAPCSFWLVDNLALSGRIADARNLFERAVSYANDVGLMSEEINPVTRELLGNFPQGLTHLALIHAALGLAKAERSARTPAHNTAAS